jgi:hypothetical protein
MRRITSEVTVVAKSLTMSRGVAVSLREMASEPPHIICKPRYLARRAAPPEIVCVLAVDIIRDEFDVEALALTS